MRFGSGKLSVAILNHFLSDKAITSKEIDVILWLSIRQDEYGRTFGVKYSDVCNDIGMSHQEYYNCMDKLEQKNFIRIMVRNRNGWDVEIIDNVFVDAKDDKKGYLNTNRSFLFSKPFIQLKAFEKKIILKLLIQKSHFNTFFLQIRTLQNWIGITNTQLLTSYMKNIKKFFSLVITKKERNTQFIIFNLHSYIDNQTKDDMSIRQHFLKHKIIATCRQLKAFFTETTIADLITLLGQYPKHYTLVKQIAIDCIYEKKCIEPKLINHIINDKIKK